MNEEGKERLLICPIRRDLTGSTRCFGALCAWWDVDRCVIRSVCGALDRISDTMSD